MGPCVCITVCSHHAQVVHEHLVVALATRAMPLNASQAIPLAEGQPGTVTEALQQ